MRQYGKHLIVPCFFETISPGSLLLNDIIGHLDAILVLHRPQEALRVQRLSSKLFVQARLTLKSSTTERAVDCVRKVTSSSAHVLLRERNGGRKHQGEGEWGREKERKGEDERERPLENSYWFILSHELIPKGNSLISQLRSSAPLCI